MSDCEVCPSKDPATSRLFDVTTYYAMQLALMEVGLGSLLHAFHIPFSGFFLSLNQCYVLNRASLVASSSSTPTSRFLPMTISNSAAILKTLSPYGKKLTPMLAISMQGLLFNLGVLVFGRNLLGRCIGSLLLSLWPMIQPLLIYGIIYSTVLLDVRTHPWLDKVPLQIIITIYISIHLLLSLTVCLLTHLLPTRLLHQYDLYVTSFQSIQPNKLSPLTNSGFLHTLRGVGRDFCSPLFLCSLVLSAFFFYMTLHSLGEFFFFFFRLIAIAFLTFFFLRNISTKWCLHLFSKAPLLKKYGRYTEELLRRIKQDPDSN